MPATTDELAALPRVPATEMGVPLSQMGKIRTREAIRPDGSRVWIPADNIVAGLEPDDPELVITASTSSDTPAEEALAGDEAAAQPYVPPADYAHAGVITVPSGEKARVRANLAALKVLTTLEADNRYATPDEQSVLAAWSGWGGCPTVFDETRDDWELERTQLKAAMTAEQYASAKQSTLNAHYTDPAIAAVMWDALLDAGFDGGRVLEPGAGSGNFIGSAPPSATMVAVEIDPTSAAIAHYLYPVRAQVRNEGFEKTRIGEGSFTAAIGNVPFGGFSLADPVHNPAGHSIHNHFIIKALNLTAPGGYAALISSAFTLDASDEQARHHMHQVADLVGAVRLPSRAFQRVAATSVVTDVLLFRRRTEGEPVPAPTTADWLHTDETSLPDRNSSPVTVRMNRMFINNPHLVLGTARADHGMYRKNEVVVINDDMERLPAQLRHALAPMITEAKDRGAGLTARHHTKPALDITGLLRSDALYAADLPVGRITYNADSATFARRGYDGEPEPVKVFATRVTETKHLLRLRDLFEAAVTSQRRNDEPAIRAAIREDLNHVYDAYVAAYGPINRAKLVGGAQRTPEEAAKKLATLEAEWRADNRDPDTDEPYSGDLPEDVAVELEEQAWTASPLVRRQIHFEQLRSDPSMASLRALEHVDPDTGQTSKAAIFSRDVVVEPAPATSAAHPAEALSISVAETGRVDLDRIAGLLALDPDTALAQLHGLVYPDLDNPDTLVPATTMLSGNVRLKAEQAAARSALEPDNPAWQELTSALRQVIPPDKSPSQIGEVTLGATWIDPSDYRAFVEEVFELDGVSIEHSSTSWVVNASSGRWGAKNRTDFGFEINGKAKQAVELFEAALNQRPVVINNSKSDRERNPSLPEIDEEATTMAQVQTRKIRDEFRTWLWADPERSQRLMTEWNRRFNAWVPPRHDGTYLQLPGLSPAITPHPYQRDAVARIAAEPTALLDHRVGAGKTGTMFMAAMELKRRGLVNQPWIIVPTHLIEQFGRDVKQWYPAANVLVGRKGMDGDERRLLVAQTATSDWDMVIIPSSVFEKINVSRPRRRRYIEDQKAALEKELLQLRASGTPSQRTVKAIEKAKVALETRLKKLSKEEAKDKGLVTFEESGCDYLFVDEAHEYKNKARTCAVETLAHTGSQKAEDMSLKLAVLRENFSAQEQAKGRIITPGAERAATFATGTPIANSLAEVWVMQSYLRPDILAVAGVSSVTDWAASFTTSKQETITNTAGTRLKVVTRVAAFANPREMFAMSAQYTDVVTRAQLNAPLPRVNGHTVTVPSSIQMRDFTADLDWRLDNADPGRPDLDNVLKVLSDGRNAALDPRLANLDAPDTAHSRVHAVASKVVGIYHRSVDRQYRNASGETSTVRGALQLVFCDRGTPRTDGGWSVYDAMRDAMIDGGIPAESIAFIHDAKTAQQKEQLQDNCRSGRISVLIGSTSKMGTGMNVQARLIALHHVDVPWRPADLEQREGRAVRQGNQNAEVEIFRYVVEGTTDTVMWSKVETKAAFIEQAKAGQFDDAVTSVEDIEEQSMSEIAAATKAAATGDPRFITLVQQQEQLKELRALVAAHREARWTATQLVRDALAHIPRLQREHEALTTLLPTIEPWEAAGKPFTVAGRSYPDRPARAAALLERARATYVQLKGAGATKAVPIAQLPGGIDVMMNREMLHDNANVWLDIPGEPGFSMGRKTLWPEQSESDEPTAALRSGFTTRVENLYTKLAARADITAARITEQQDLLRALEPKTQETFDKADDLTALEMSVNKLSRELAADQNTPEAITAREQAAERMRVAGRDHGWSLHLNPTVAMVEESPFVNAAAYIAATQRMHAYNARQYVREHGANGGLWQLTDRDDPDRIDPNPPNFQQMWDHDTGPELGD